MKLSIKLILLLLILSSKSFAASSDKAFETFKNLKGKWKIQSQGKTLPVEMTYDDGSKNSIVTEQFGKELSVFYRDGQDLLMTHFCNSGNQPRLRLKKDVVDGQIEFEMFDMTNLKAAEAAHVQRVLYRIIDLKNVELELVWKTGKATESERYSLRKYE